MTSIIHRLNNEPSKGLGNDGDLAIYASFFYFKNNGQWTKVSSSLDNFGRAYENEIAIWKSASRIKGDKKLTFDESNGLNVNNKLTVTGDSSLASTSFNDNDITNVGNIALDSISPDSGTDINLNANVGIGTTSPEEALDVAGSINLTGDINLGENKKIIFDSADTFIRSNTANPEDMIISADDDIILAPDDDVIIEHGATAWSTFQGDERRLGVNTTSPTTTLDVEGTVSYKHTAFSTAGPTDSIDVSDTTVLEVDTSSNNVTIGGFSGGVQGQVLYIVKTDTTNFIQLEHNETPTAGSHQKIYLTTGSDERVVGYGGYTLYCNGTAWFSLSNPTGAADAG